MASAGDSKFGWFGGVFTPSILTILGVIMYLRLPQLVGAAGLAQAIGFILAAHVVSVCTGLSISSIATDKSVGAGGPYYIISRSLGLPIGGTLGLALFVGLAFSISLYVIGFSESFLALLGYEATNLTAIRVCGTITIVLLTVITFVSTSLAIKTQYVILALIAISLVAIFFGTPPVPAEAPLIGAPEMPQGESAPSFFMLFGVFFPAVTGFTAGVNMSGDLRDPKGAIPKGTMAAITVGLVVYVGLAVFLAFRVDDVQLRENPTVLEDLSLWGPAVTAGIWGATLSSALGSILGAPRILQTVAGDGIVHRWLSVGFGKTNEPRNALLVAFAIGEVGILIGELDAIAEIVSMIFLATYAFLNVACAIESWVSPDFRPEFRIPKTVSVVGAVTTVLLMIQLNLPAMAGAVTIMAALFVWLQRRQLTLASGDAWEGIWSNLVRMGLHRLATADRTHRNWTPNILLFRPDDDVPREGLGRTAGALITGNGMLTDVRLRPTGQRASDDAPRLLESGPVVGVFERTVETDDPYETIGALATHHGYSGVEPNTVLLDYDAYRADGEALAKLLDRLRAQDFNTLLFSDTTHKAMGPPRLDVWWHSSSSPSLGLALTRFITDSAEGRRMTVRFVTVSRDSTIIDGLRTSTRRMLQDARVTGDVEVILDTVDPRPLEAHVCEHSADARLAIVELPAESIADRLDDLFELTRTVPSVLFIAPSSQFASVGRVVRATQTPATDAEVGVGETELPPLRLPELPALAQHAEAFATQLEASLGEYFDQSLTRVAARNFELLDRTTALIDKHFGLLRSGLTNEPNPVKRRRAANRVQSAFLHACGALIEQFVLQDLADQRDILEGRTRALVDDRSLVSEEEVLVVERDASDFATSGGDSRELAKLKRSRLAAAQGGKVRYEQPTAGLARYYVHKELVELADDLTRAYVTECGVLAVHLLKVFNASRTSLTLIHGAPDLDAENALLTFIETERESAQARLSEIREHHETRLAALRAELANDARELTQDYTDDLARPELPVLLDSRRKVAQRQKDALARGLVESATVLYSNQRALFERAQVGLQVSAFQHRLATIVERTRESIAIEVKNQVVSPHRDLRDALVAFLEEERDAPLELRLQRSEAFDPQAVVDAFVRDAQRSADELPETVRTLTDQSIQRLADGDHDGVEHMDLPLRRLAQFLVDVELVGPLTELLTEVPVLETQAVGVAEDVTRLIGFHQAEYDPEQTERSRFEHMQPVVESSRERIEAQLEPLEEIVPTVEEALEAKLAAVLRGTDVYELTTSASALGQQVRRRQGQLAVSGVQSLAMKALDRAREALVGAVYGQSAGVLMARRLRDAEDAGTLVDRLLRFVEGQQPDADVLESLPFYYRQLFFGKATFNETFWVEREAEVAAARRGIAQHDRGGRGVLIVTGEPDSGKTMLCRRLLSRSLSKRPTFWVTPPESGDARLAAFSDALRAATGQRGAPLDVLASVPDKSVVVIEDLELWWERTEDGLAVVDCLLECVAAHGDRALFVIEVGSHPFDVIDRLRPLSDHALAVVECGPLPAASLKEIVMLRHGSTGTRFSLEGRSEAELGEWRIAQLFSQYFGATRGLVGTVLASWIANVEGVAETTIEIRAPRRAGWEVLDGLRPEWVAILVQLLLHKRLTRPRLQRIARMDAEQLDGPLDVLTRVGLILESRHGVLRLDRFTRHALIERLRARRVIP